MKICGFEVGLNKPLFMKRLHLKNWAQKTLLNLISNQPLAVLITE